VDPRWGEPLAIRGEIALLTDGRFHYDAGMFGGTQGSMGPSAVVRLGSIQLLIQSRSTYDWGDEQYRSVGLQPNECKWVVVKNMMNFRQGYAANMKAYFLLDSPGPTPPDRRALPGFRAKRPWFPMDEQLDPGPLRAVR
jgi:microcystin degradation protein MlrC